jgi:hypothetical protein
MEVDELQRQVNNATRCLPFLLLVAGLHATPGYADSLDELHQLTQTPSKEKRL